MVRQYFENLKLLWLRPAEFFFRDLDPQGEKEAFRFANLTGILVALEFGLAEILSRSSIVNVGLVIGGAVLAMPFLVTSGIYLWAGFLRLCGYLLEENIPLEPARQVVAYSTAGIALLGLVGFGIGKWLFLAAFFFQVVGMERVLRCSRWTAGVLVGLPFSLVTVLMLLTGFMFKVFK